MSLHVYFECCKADLFYIFKAAKKRDWKIRSSSFQDLYKK